MMKNESYFEMLKDPRWQKKRLNIFNRDMFRCVLCGDTESTLHIHHREYIKGRDPWDYPDSYLTTLCHICHDVISAHNNSDWLLKNLKTITINDINDSDFVLKIYNMPGKSAMILVSNKSSYNAVFIPDEEKGTIIKLLKL